MVIKGVTIAIKRNLAAKIRTTAVTFSVYLDIYMFIGTALSIITAQPKATSRGIHSY